MQAARLPSEEARLAALYEYDILDKPIAKEFEDVTKLISRACNAPIAVINLIDRDRQWFVSEVGLGVRETPLDISICAHAILQPGLFIVEDTLQNPLFADNPLVTGDPHLRYYAGALLETEEGHPLGTLCVLDYKPRELTDEQKELIQVLARQVMRQLELRRLLRLQYVVIKERDDARQALTVQYDHQRQIAETLQRSLLLDADECSFAGIDIVPRYEAASLESIVGGDFYDSFALDGDRIALVVGDVTGKGLEAAARTAEVKYALRAFLQEYPYPALSLDRLNDFLYHFHCSHTNETPRFVAAVVSVIDTRTGAVLLAHAGAEPAIVVRQDGTASVLNPGGLPLGIDPGVKYDAQSVTLSAGDVLVLATDGITESRRSGTFLGTEGFVEIIQAAVQPVLSDWADAVLDDVKSYCGGVLHDDVCVILARLRDL